MRAAAGTAIADESPASSEFHGFIADIEHLITSMTPLTGEDLSRAKAKLSERVAVAKESLSAMNGEIADRARKTAHHTDHYVREYPWQAVGVGAALGVLVGIAVARRN
jgi:ElaB/YqjD/DUF883 family membrane-anchored ribosome-binding protein